MNSARKLRRFSATLLTCVFLSASLPGLAASTTLRLGSRGTAVLQLQQALNALGYDTNGADGKFGKGTERAVKAYQQANGLTADGKAGVKTLAQLYSGSSVSGSTSGTASSEIYTAKNPNTLQSGDSGSKVTQLQNALKLLGFYTGGVDGKFGSGTKNAVIQFQRANGLTADGLAGTKTQTLLYAQVNNGISGGTSSSGSSSSGTSSGTSGFTRTLRKGYTGADVIAVQQKLKELGFYSGSVDGVYGTGSIAAVKKFQQQNGLTADGLVGSRTYTALMSASTGSSSNSGSDNSSSSSDSTSGQDYAEGTLSYGSSGTEVKKMQQALKALGYNVSADGSYGALTQMAVTQFQKRNGLTADGVAGSATLKLLYSGNAKEADPSADDNMSIDDSTGKANGPSVSSVKLLHWFNEVKPSLKNGNKLIVFDPATNLQWTLKAYSLGRHCDSEPLTETDTKIMYKAFGNKNTWTPKPVYVQLPSGVWTLASMHNVPHLSGSISDNGFNGHLCVHFLRDMDECQKNDPNYGVQNQNAIRKKWKEMTGITVN
ncbi:MAG: peptidoglycan-binding protein [Candidatus Limiplasma sp.]|nr:peptidoglycan-binding protein [Candidatus Limiplasma sp.]